MIVLNWLKRFSCEPVERLPIVMNVDRFQRTIPPFFFSFPSVVSHHGVACRRPGGDRTRIGPRWPVAPNRKQTVRALGPRSVKTLFLINGGEVGCNIVFTVPLVFARDQGERVMSNQE